MRGIKTLIICIVLFVAERILFGHITIFSMTPCLLLAFWFDMSVLSEDTGCIPLYAGICGLLLDVTGGGQLGVNTALYAVGCLMVGFVVAGFLRSGFLTGMAVNLVMFVIVELFGLWLNGIDAGGAFLSLVVPQSVLNAFFAALMYPAVKRLYFYRRLVL